MLQFNNKECELSVYKDGDKIYGELFIEGVSINKESKDFLIDLSEYENQKLKCVLDGKSLSYEDFPIKEYVNVFKKNTILDLEVSNGIGKIKLNDFVIDEINCDLNRKHYKINVQNDENYTIVRYANLHQHTENSLLDGIVRIPELANKSEYACAITDHGNMFGWYDMLKAFEKVDKKAIIGEEFYIETLDGPRPVFPKNIKKEVADIDELMFDNSKVQNEDGLNGEHLIVLAKNNTGLKNLFWLSSQASLHFYRKPHITFEELLSHKDGLIVCSACIASGVNQFIKEYLKAKEYPSVKNWIENYGEFFYDDPYYKNNENKEELNIYAYNHTKARKWIKTLKEAFKEDFYLEYQDHHFPLEAKIMDELVRIRNEEFPDIKIVATCDAHYLNKEDAYVHELFLCNQTKKTIDDPKHMKFSGDGYYVHTSKEMLELFPVEYLDNTLEIEEKIQYEPLEKGYHLPHYPLPEGFENEYDYFKYLCKQGFKEKFKGTDKYNDDVYVNRLKTEANTVKQMGWPSYFLIVRDFIKWAEDTNVEAHWQDYFPNKEFNEIPKEILKTDKVYTGSGRGCVDAETLIYTKNSLKKIKDITTNDKVWTHNGNLKNVVATYKYPINEPLYKINCYYGDNFGNSYTSDHKILVIKHVKETDKMKLHSGIKYKMPTDLTPKWVSAKDVELGDYVIQPKFKTKESNKKYIDLRKYCEKKKHYSILGDKIIWERSYHNPQDVSAKQVRKFVKCNHSVIDKFLKGVPTSKDEEIRKFLLSQNTEPEKWKKEYYKNHYKTEYIPAKLEINEKLMYVLGVMTGDGWIRNNRNGIGVCFNKKEFRKEQIEIFEEVFGIKFNARFYDKNPNLIQFETNCYPLGELFKDFWKGYDYTAKTKTFPDWVLELNDENKRAFIDGLWASDGCNKNKTSYDSVSFELISKIKILLCSLGIANGIVFRPAHYSPNAKGKNCKDSWKITVSKNFAKESYNRNYFSTDSFVAKRVRKIEILDNIKEVYDITVEDEHSYVTSNYTAHNSGAGSLVNDCLGITKVDPLEYDLKFERFLNPDRISMPKQNWAYKVNV